MLVDGSLFVPDPSNLLDAIDPVPSIILFISQVYSEPNSSPDFCLTQVNAITQSENCLTKKTDLFSVWDIQKSDSQVTLLQLTVP